MQGTGDSKAPDTRARDERIKAHLDLVKSIAGDIRARPLGRGMDLDDLVAYGAIGLVEAATRFEERGVPFSAFARRRIVRRDRRWHPHPTLVRPPRRPPSSNRPRRSRLAGRARRRPSGPQRRPAERPPDGLSPTETDDVNEQVAAALRGLPALERRVVEIHHYQEKTITQAAKELGICRPWTSRLHARALAALRAALEGRSLPLPPERRNARLELDRREGVSRGFAALDPHGGTIGEGVAR